MKKAIVLFVMMSIVIWFMGCFKKEEPVTVAPEVEKASEAVEEIKTESSDKKIKEHAGEETPSEEPEIIIVKPGDEIPAVSPSISIEQTGPAEVIGKEALIQLDSRLRFSTLVNNSPADGMDAEVNPPRFRWTYVPNPLNTPGKILPSMFQFQIAGDTSFSKPVVNIRTELNVYNELAPLAEGKIYYWRVGYIPYGKETPTVWSDTFSFNVLAGTPQWDRSCLKNPQFSDHPRLLFRGDQLEELRRIAKDDINFKKEIMSSAKAMIKHKWWNNWPDSDKGLADYYDGFYYMIGRELTRTAMAYLITEDEKYSNILDIWTKIASYPKGGASSPEGMGVGANDEDNTSVTEFMACVYDWFYDKLTPEQHAVFEKSLEWRISAWMYEFWWGGALYTGGELNPYLTQSSIFIAGAGHSWEGAMDTLAAAVAIYEKSDVAKKYFHWMVNYAISVGEKVAQNGGYDLGAHYGQSHMKWLIYQLMYLNSALPELKLGTNPLYRQYGEFFIGLVPVGMQYCHWGRIGQHGAGVGMKMEVFNLLAYLTGSGEILHNWMSTGTKNRFNYRPWIHVAAPLHFEGKLEPVPLMKTKYFFPATGFVMAHKYPPSDPKAFKEGVGVTFCSRPSRGDGYNSENAFQIYGYGEHLNYGGHSGDENPFGYQTMAHNTVLADGIGQSWTKEAARDGYRAVLLAYKEADTYTYWMGDATNAYPRDIIKMGHPRSQIAFDKRVYGDKGAPKIERFRRHMLFMRDKYLVVFDDLKTAPERPSRFTWLYRVLKKSNPKYSSKTGHLEYTTGKVKVHIKHIAYPDSIEFQDLQDLDQYKNPLTGRDYMMNNPYTRKDMKNEKYRKKVCQHNFWMTTKEPKSDHHFLVVVYPVEPGTEDPEITRLDDYTVKIVKDGETDIISFDKNTSYPATLVVDLDAFRDPVPFKEVTIDPNADKGFTELGEIVEKQISPTVVFEIEDFELEEAEVRDIEGASKGKGVILLSKKSKATYTGQLKKGVYKVNVYGYFPDGDHDGFRIQVYLPGNVGINERLFPEEWKKIAPARTVMAEMKEDGELTIELFPNETGMTLDRIEFKRVK